MSAATSPPKYGRDYYRYPAGRLSAPRHYFSLILSLSSFKEWRFPFPSTKIPFLQKNRSPFFGQKIPLYINEWRFPFLLTKKVPLLSRKNIPVAINKRRCSSCLLILQKGPDFPLAMRTYHMRYTRTMKDSSYFAYVCIRSIIYITITYSARKIFLTVQAFIYH